MLGEFHPLFISVHANRRELTTEVVMASRAWPMPAFQWATSRYCSRRERYYC